MYVAGRLHKLPYAFCMRQSQASKPRLFNYHNCMLCMQQQNEACSILLRQWKWYSNHTNHATAKCNLSDSKTHVLHEIEILACLMSGGSLRSFFTFRCAVNRTRGQKKNRCQHTSALRCSYCISGSIKSLFEIASNNRLMSMHTCMHTIPLSL